MALMAIQRWVAGSQRSYAALFAMSLADFLVAPLAVHWRWVSILSSFLSRNCRRHRHRVSSRLVRKAWFLIPVLSVAFAWVCDLPQRVQ